MSEQKAAAVEQVPVLHVRGTHYEVGLSIGRTFASYAKEFLTGWDYVTNELIPAYETARGRKIYEDTLAVCKRRYPQYVEELEGIAEGAGVPFHVSFLTHLMGLVSEDVDDNKEEEESPVKLGCTGVISNYGDLLLGHNEDTPLILANRFLIISAQILDKEGNVIEDFSSLAYPGILPGYTMGYNRHGFVHCVNTVCPAKTRKDGTPILFLSRAILGAKNLEDAVRIFKDEGVGASDGISLNFISANEPQGPVAGNIEVGPQRDPNLKESEVSVHLVERGSTYVHCNIYQRLDHPEVKSYSSSHRHAAIDKLPPPNSAEDVRRILSDQSDYNFPVFRVGPRNPGGGKQEDGQDTGCTVATGLFNVTNKTWSIYTRPSLKSEPVVVLPMNFY